jgi:hypothetical protein
MGLRTCPDCGSEISTAAPTCPKCGRPQRRTSPAAWGCLIIVLIVAFIGILDAIFSGNDENASTDSGNTVAAPPAASIATPSHATPHHSKQRQRPPINLNDATALDNKYDIDANVGCGDGADDYLRQAAKYEFKWDDIGFFESKFDKYLKVVSARGILTLVTDKVSLQNGFGAYQHVELLCYYDTQKGKVLRYEVVE